MCFTNVVDVGIVLACVNGAVELRQTKIGEFEVLPSNFFFSFENLFLLAIW